ncbi:MAG TPA: hypothetical protein VH021_15700 [Trebonia sp.]|nr:hypothetical protein [Trebonia sp.]
MRAATRKAPGDGDAISDDDARAGLRAAGCSRRREVREPADADQRTLVDRYAVAALTRLLAADATFEMPPAPDRLPA